MTVSTTTNRISYAGNDSTTAFATGFKFYANGDLTVTLVTDSTGAEVVKVITTDYTVADAGVDSGGTVTMGTPPATGETLVIERTQAYTQPVDLVENDPFPSNTVEQQLDRMVIMAQQNDSTLTRSLRQPDGDTTDIDKLPVKVTRATKVLAFDSDGDPVASTSTLADIEDGATDAAASAAAALISANAAAADLVLTNADVVTTGANATLSANYATKIDGAVTGSDYASKAWAIGGTDVTTTSARGAAKEWATTTGAAVDTSEFSAKEYSQGTTVSTGSSKQWALGGASFDVDTVVAGGEFSAKKYAANAAASAAQAASGQIYSTVVNQTGAALSPALSADGTYYLCDTSSNDITVTLPAIGTAEGTKYAFQKTSASNSLIFQRSGTDTLNGSASDITITDVNAQIQFVADDNSPDNWVGVQMSQITVGAGLTKVGSVVSIGDDAIVPSMVQGTVNAQTGTTYTAVLLDDHKIITCSNSSAIAFTLPTNASVAFPVGAKLSIAMIGAGVVTITGDTGVYINGISAGSGALAQYGACDLVKLATDTWLAVGLTVA